MALLATLHFPVEAQASEEDAETSSEPTADEPLDTEIVITGTRTETTRKDSVVATDVINRADILDSGASTAADLFKTRSGVSLQRSFAGTAIRLQGLNPEHVLILIDGQRVVGRKNGAIDLSRYPVDWIERVEIVKGTSSVLYGSDAMGGVINIITRKADAPFSTDVYGSYSTPNDVDGSASIATKQETYSTRIHGGIHSTSGYDLDESTLATNGSTREMFHAGSISHIQLTPDWQLTPRVSYRQEDKQGVSESGGGAVFDDRNLSEEIQGAVGSDAWVSAHGRLRSTSFITWYRDQYDSNQRESNALDSYQNTQELLLQSAVQYDHTFEDRHLSTLGVDVLSERMKSDRLDDGDGDRNRIGVFVQDEWTLNSANRLVLLPGARLDIDSQFGTHPTPRLAVRYDPHKKLALRAGIGWGYRAPSFKELLLRFENSSAGYIVEGSPDLDPETARNINLGLDWAATDSVWLSIAGYRNDVKDLIGFGTLEDGIAGSPTRYGYINIAEAITQGGELNLDTAPTENLSVVAGYALTDTLDVQHDRPLEGRSFHQVTGQLRQDIPQWGSSFSVRATWNSPQAFFRDTNGDGTEERVDSDSTTLFDARAAQDLQIRRTGMRLFIGIENILNDGDPEYLPLPPRTYYAGLTGRYPSDSTTESR